MGKGTGSFLLRNMQTKMILSVTAATVSTKKEMNSDIHISTVVSEVTPAVSCPTAGPGVVVVAVSNTERKMVAVVVKVEMETSVMVVIDSVVAMDTHVHAKMEIITMTNRCTCTL